MDRANLQERIAAAIGQYDNDTSEKSNEKSNIEQKSPMSPNQEDSR